MRPRHTIAPNIEDRIRGCIFGHAIGDALGFGAEGWAKADIENRYEGGLRDFGQIRATGMRTLLKPGKFELVLAGIIWFCVGLTALKCIWIKYPVCVGPSAQLMGWGGLGLFG